MEWKTKQQGAVGRMKVDKALLQLIAQLEGQLGVQPYGQELISILRDSYREGTDIASATFRLVNHLFASYGLLVLVADDPRLKRKMEMVFQEDLFLHVPHALVNESGDALQSAYKVQVNPREINLFYLNEGLRERIIEDAGQFKVERTDLRFTQEEMKNELAVHPERFSPNVVLRALYQETILPNVAFIGGGAELAYWLEMKGMFDHYQVPFPVLVLRNSFLLGRKAQESRLASFGFKMEDLFLPEFEIMNKYVAAHSANTLDVNEESTAADQLLSGLKNKAAAVDQTLLPHVEAIHARFQKQLNEAGKKLLRAEKRKFDDQRNQLLKIKSQLFPNGSLQERVDNFMPYYAQHGMAFIDALYKHSPALEQEFIILIDQLAN
jgi:bacillithiol biosynthesis cysteine-adding enzyme BshC